MEELIDQKQAMKNKRGKTLQVLCILSWIAIGWSFISIAWQAFEGPLTEEQMEEEKYEALSQISEDSPQFAIKLVEESIELGEVFNENFWPLLSINLLIVLVGFAAVFMMYRLRRAGFYVYILYSLMPLGVSMTYFSGFSITVWGLVLSGLISTLFIILYGAQLNKMS